MEIGYMALWGFRAKCRSEWVSGVDTPQTVLTTRAPAVLTKHNQNILTMHNFNRTYLQIDNRSTVSDLLSQPARLWEGLILILYYSFILFTNSSHYLACQTLGNVDFDYGVITLHEYLISMFYIALVNILWS